MKALRRLQRLERHGHDPSGLVPHTQKWHEYWHERIYADASDDYQGPRPLFPLEAFREFMATRLKTATDNEYCQAIRERMSDHRDPDLAALIQNSLPDTVDGLPESGSGCGSDLVQIWFGGAADDQECSPR